MGQQEIKDQPVLFRLDQPGLMGQQEIKALMGQLVIKDQPAP
jgi:hypothetical protein